MTDTEGARLFRETWIAGVTKHYPGEPKASYVTPWEDTPDWEREAARAVYQQVRHFLGLSDGNAKRLTREQKGRFVATCWTAQMYKHFGDPKPAYVADWPDLPDWQQETDSDIFEAIETAAPQQ
ncbi:hypothetical protein [Streptomyces qinglanensis]|uniref:Uncharacterized protein n=1 Tax=Streptomyces qinglanensis TaxID=943816 RepID=A0A1H9NLF7_9ACTN|nr:hypothetical protein [Streptomyces qinglanensis]SER36722.1 hypothetical protein SAMN05421870_101485 [Streptomyces qinglanensis]